MSSTVVPRGVRNANPGNLKWGEPWQGLVDRKLATDGTFCQFESPTYGIRAMVRVLDTYRDRYDLCTVRDIIDRWAPPQENATNIYAEFVASRLGVTTGEYIDTADGNVMRHLVAAIIRFENGVGTMPSLSTWYMDRTIDEAIDLARTGSGAGTAAGGIVGTGAVAGVVAVANGWGSWTAWIAGAVLVIVAGAAVAYFIGRRKC